MDERCGEDAALNGSGVGARRLRLLRIATGVLIGVGVAGAIYRTVRLDDAIQLLEPLRTLVYAHFELHDPLGAERMAIAARMDGHFSAHPGLTLAHVIAGGLFLAFAPLQFSAGLRRRQPRLHRIVGRLLVGCALVSVIPAFFFGFVNPFGGRPETVVITLFGALLVLALAQGVRAIRAGRQAFHREWMIRAFALGLAISTVRLVGALIDPLFSPRGVRPEPLFVASLWAGWLSTLAVAELWIRHTRKRTAG